VFGIGDIGYIIGRHVFVLKFAHFFDALLPQILAVQQIITF
jgi:hypothetical protein